jgi:putative ABC transport system permease protein
MLTIAWQNFRTRPGRFAGSLVALTLGVALIAATVVVLVAQSGPHPAAQADAYAELSALVGIMAGISGLVCVFVVAGTAGLSILQRRQELALLRLVGATPRQVRRMVVAEAALLGLVAALLGNALALPTAHLVVAGLHHLNVGPPHLALSMSWIAALIAGGGGLVVAVSGVWLAARRTRKFRAVEALRTAAVETKRMSVSRWLFTVLGLGGGVAMLVSALHMSGGDGRFALLLLAGNVLVIGAAAIAPLLVPVLVRLISLPFRRDIGVEVAVANLRAQARRTAAVAAPILLMLGMAGSTLTAVTTLSDNSITEEGNQLVAPYVLTNPTSASVAALRAAPGVTAVAPVGEIQINLSPTDQVYAMAIADPGNVDLFHYPTVTGSYGAGVVVTVDTAAARHWHLGDRITYTPVGGRPTSLPLVATVPQMLSGYQLLVPADAGGWRYAAVSVKPGTDVTKLPGDLETRAAYLNSDAANLRQGNNVGLIAVFGMAALYTAIAIVNTLVMSVRERISELARFRLAGGTPGQAMRLLYTEAALVFGVGTGLAAGVTGLTAYAMPVSLQAIGVSSALVIPWVPLVIAAAGCAVLVFGATLVAGRYALRRPPLTELGTAE